MSDRRVNDVGMAIRIGCGTRKVHPPARLTSRLARSTSLFLILACPVVAEPLWAQAADTIPPPGQLVDIGGYRIHLWCSGSSTPGRPTVVLSSGAGGYALDWALIQPVIAESSRVCSYDRANFGWSDLGPNPRTLRQEVFELHAALLAAGERLPFVLVGHSMGGVVVRLFADAHPQEVAGMVLVDPTHENARLGYRGELVRVRTRATDRPVPPPATFQQSPPEIASGEAAEQCLSEAASATVFGPYVKLPADEQRALLWLLQNPKCFLAADDYLGEEMNLIHAARSRNPQPLGSLPLVVLAGTQVSPPPGIERTDWQREKLAEKTDLARLSARGRVVTDPASGHHIHIDNPSLVIDAIRDVMRSSSQ